MIRITVDAEIPDADLEPFLDWMRAFDKSHSGCHFKIAANSDGDETVGELVQMLERVGIPIVFAAKTERK